MQAGGEVDGTPRAEGAIAGHSSARGISRSRSRAPAALPGAQPMSGPSPSPAREAAMEEAGSFPIAAWSMAFQAMALAANACSKIAQVATFAAVSPEVRKNHTPFHPAAGDHRFRNPMWRSAPWDVMVQSQLALEQFWQEIRPPGLNSDRSVTALEAFATEKMVRAAAPSNFLWSNPVAVENLLRTRGKSLLDGTWNWVEDSAA